MSFEGCLFYYLFIARTLSRRNNPGPHYLSGLLLPFLSVWMFPSAMRRESHKEINVLNKTCGVFFYYYFLKYIQLP